MVFQINSRRHLSFRSEVFKYSCIVIDQNKMIVVVLVVLLLVLGFIKYILYVQNMESAMKGLKTFKPRLPFIGDIKFFMEKTLQELHEDFIEVIMRCKTPFKAQIGPAFFVVLDQPEDIYKDDSYLTTLPRQNISLRILPTPS